MSDSYFELYRNAIQGMSVLGNVTFHSPEAFYHAYRKAVNSISAEYVSEKWQGLKKLIIAGKCLIFTNCWEHGILPVIELAKLYNTTIDKITGEVAPDKRQCIVDKFNNNEIDILVISKAGSEGLDLKGVSTVIVLDPPWNYSSLEQIVGRAIRYKSHEHLPKEERFVDVYYMLLIPGRYHHGVSSGDEILFKQFVETKRYNGRYILNILSKITL